jgi:hypothetical protein
VVLYLVPYSKPKSVELFFLRVVVGVQGQLGVGCPNTDTATRGLYSIKPYNNSFRFKFL